MCTDSDTEGVCSLFPQTFPESAFSIILVPTDTRIVCCTLTPAPRVYVHCFAMMRLKHLQKACHHKLWCLPIIKGFQGF